MPVKTSSLDCNPITLIVKSCSALFGDLMSKLAYLSFTAEGIFPDHFKLSQVIPIPKKHGLAVDDHSNYRPKTNLCTFGKVLEKLAQGQLRSHINASPIIHHCNRPIEHNHSTETAMTKVVSDLLHG